jgi:hypothetical protein
MEKQTKSSFKKGQSSETEAQVFDEQPADTPVESAVTPHPVLRYRATKGHTLPISYKGSIIHIGTTEAVEIDVEALAYEPRIQFMKALRDKQIFVEGLLQ